MDKKFMEVKRRIRDEICKLSPGTKLPSERDLIEQFGYSRPTIQKALVELEKEGVIYRLPRQGSFVADSRLRKSLNQLQSFKEDILAGGDVPSTRLISFEKIFADKNIAKKLVVEEGDPVYRIVRLRLKNGDPIIYDVNYFCPFAIQGIGVDALVDSIYEYKEQTRGLHPSMSEETVDAILPDREIADQLGLKANEPVIKIEMVAYLTDGRAFEYTCSYKNPKKYCLEIRSYRG
ncbi:MAG: GntR family transcriptional regulator [Blautia sp.]